MAMNENNMGQFLLVGLRDQGELTSAGVGGESEKFPQKKFYAEKEGGGLWLDKERRKECSRQREQQEDSCRFSGQKPDYMDFLRPQKGKAKVLTQVEML